MGASPMRPSRRAIGIVLDAKTADAADIFHALLVGGEATIHGPARASAVLGTPRIILRLRRRAERRDNSYGEKKCFHRRSRFKWI
jgi:hypothetical protein